MSGVGELVYLSLSVCGGGYLCVCICVCRHTCLCTYTWNPEISIWRLSLLFSTLFCEIESPTEAGVRHISEAACLEDPVDWPVSISSALGFLHDTQGAVPHFDDESELRASHLCRKLFPTEPAP